MDALQGSHRFSAHTTFALPKKPSLLARIIGFATRPIGYTERERRQRIGLIVQVLRHCRDEADIDISCAIHDALFPSHLKNLPMTDAEKDEVAFRHW